MMMEDSDMNTTLHLVDFVVASFDETNHTIMRFELFDKLKEKMRNGKKRIVKPFEMKFELVHTLGKVSESGDNSDLFHHPFDVKISYNFEIILISDSSNGKIKVFDMHTKQFKKSIRTAVAMPMYLAVEENYDHSNSDAIIFGCNSDSTIFKFDLGKELICSDQEKSSPPYLWASTAVKNSQGITCSNKSGHVFVCDASDGSIKVLKSSSGQLLQSIALSLHPYGIEFANFFGDDYLIVSQSNTLKNGNDQCQIFRLTRTTSSTFQIDLVTTFGRGGSLEREFDWPSSLTVDHASMNIIVGDYRNHRIQIFSKDGTFIACLNDFGSDRICYPNGLCLNVVLGELISCDWANHVVQFFK